MNIVLLSDESNILFWVQCYFCIVVWNPWERMARALPDLGDDEYKHMICVAPAGIEKLITLKPGEEWKGRLKITTVYSSYHSGHLDPIKVQESLAAFERNLMKHS